MEEKNLQLDRMVFFCDAVVAIAITLLALNIKIDHTASGHLAFADILGEWKVFAAFFLSFINIANFWKVHHSFFSYIKKIDEKLLWFNIGWLFFIVILPFSTSLVSAYFFDMPAILVYSLNIFLVALFQNMIWDYASLQGEFLKRDLIEEKEIKQYQLFCNFDMANAVLAVGIAFFNPALAFISLFTKLPLIVVASFFMLRKRGELPKRPVRNRRHKKDDI